MFPSALRLVPLAALLLAAVSSAAADEFAQDCHPWSGFGVGSWRQVRMISETLDENGRVVSTNTSESTTTLVNVTDDEVTLRIVSSIEVDGKRITAEPKNIVQGLFGQSSDEKAVVKQLENEEITVEGRAINCRRQQIELASPEQKRLITVSYSEELLPYVLRRTVTSLDDQGQVNSTETQQVIALDMPYRLPDGVKPTAYVRSVYNNHKCNTTTLAVYSGDVPGHVVASSTKELDKKGRLLRRSTMELLQYEIQSDERPTLGSRLQQRRELRRQRR